MVVMLFFLLFSHTSQFNLIELKHLVFLKFVKLSFRDYDLNYPSIVDTKLSYLVKNVQKRLRLNILGLLRACKELLLIAIAMDDFKRTCF